jgi:hypothetical protein
MWPFLKDLLCRGFHQAVLNSRSAPISWLLRILGIPVVAYLAKATWDWVQRGERTWAALRSKFKSSDPMIGGAVILLIVLACTFGYSLLGVLYADHSKLAAAEARTCPVCSTNKTPPEKAAVKPTQHEGVHLNIRQGSGSTANPGVNAGHIKQGDCGVVQNGGSGNVAAPNCNPSRDLSQSDSMQISNSLRLMPKPLQPVYFTYYYAAEDGESYLRQLQKVISDGGWPINPYVFSIAATPVFDGNLRGVVIVVRDKNDANGTLIQKAFTAGGVKADILPLPTLPSDRSAQVWVGRK